MIFRMDTLSAIDDLPERLAQRLKAGLPGRTAQQTMEAELALGRHFGSPLPDAKAASVVALLHRRAGEWQLPLLLRPESLTFHPGQIGLPGGRVEPGETSEDAALRELEEELGVRRSAAVLLGSLSPLYVFGTNFLITPWLAASWSDVQFIPCMAEVEMILEIPLDHFMNPANRGEHVEKRGRVRLRAPHFVWGDHHIWGATAMILAELTAILSDVAHSATAETRTA